MKNKGLEATAPQSPGVRAAESLFECAEHAMLEMRDRFDLKRGDSFSLDALEDAIEASRPAPPRSCDCPAAEVKACRRHFGCTLFNTQVGNAP